MDDHRLAISAITTLHWSAWEDLNHYRRLGIRGIGLWRQKLATVDLADYRRALDAYQMTVTNLCFTGQFTRGVEQAVADGIEALNIAARVGAPVVLVISGPIDRLTFAEADRAVVDGLRQLAPEAERLGIGLALEALHPMDMTQWTTVPTVDKALDLIDQVDSVWVGLMLDLYNAWWDPGLKRAIERAGSRILGVQLADWRNPTRSFTDRAVPGDGVAPLAQYIEWVERTGYRGWYDVEIFSDALWALNDYRPVIEKCREWWGRVFKEAGA